MIMIMIIMIIMIMIMIMIMTMIIMIMIMIMVMGVVMIILGASCAGSEINQHNWPCEFLGVSCAGILENQHKSSDLKGSSTTGHVNSRGRVALGSMFSLDLRWNLNISAQLAM